MEENIILPQEETTAEVVDIQFRPGQKEWGQKLLANNFFYYCVYPENADEVLKELTEIMK